MDEISSKQILVILNEKFNEYIVENQRNEPPKLNFEGLGNILELVQKNFSNFVPIDDESETVDRDELTKDLMFLFNQVMFIACHDTKKELNDVLQNLQKLILETCFVNQPWLFNKLIIVFNFMLKQTLVFDECFSEISEIQIPFMLAEADPHSTVQYNYRKIIIDSEESMKNLVVHCIVALTYVIKLYTNIEKELALESRQIIMDIFIRRSLVCKNTSLVFFSKYFKALTKFSNSDTQCFLKILESTANICKDLPNWINDPESAKNSKIFHRCIQKVLLEVNIELMTFNDQRNVCNLMNSVSLIIYIQMKATDETCFSHPMLTVLADFAARVLYKFHYEPETVEVLEMILQYRETQAILLLMRFAIVGELEKVEELNNQVYESSTTWNHYHDRMKQCLNALPLTVITKSFNEQIALINEFLQLAVHVEFDFTQRHQAQHIKITNGLCKYKNVDSPGYNDPLMMFKHWDYKHIKLSFFSDLDSLARQLMNDLSNRNDINIEMIKIMIEICTAILHLSLASNLSDETKNILMSVVLSPFYKAMKLSDKYNKNAGFLKVLNMMPNKLKVYFEKASDKNQLESLKLQEFSIAHFTQLNVTRVNNFCLWLSLIIIEYVQMSNEPALQQRLMRNYVMFMARNVDGCQYYINAYQKMLNDMKVAGLIENLHTVLCISDCFFTITRKSNIISSCEEIKSDFIYEIICKSCYNENMLFPPDTSDKESMQRLFAYVIKYNAVIASSNYINPNVPKLYVTNALMNASRKDCRVMMIRWVLPALNHSENFKTMIQEDKGEILFDRIIALDVLEELNVHFSSILNWIKSSSNMSEEIRNTLLRTCLGKINLLTNQASREKSAQMQSLTIRTIFNYAATINDEITTTRCLKLMLYFVILDSSQVMGDASLSIIEMCQRNGFQLNKLFNWYKTNILEHIIHLAVTNDSGFITTMTNFVRRLDFATLREFLTVNLQTILSILLPICHESQRIGNEMKAVCMYVQRPFADCLQSSLLSIYQHAFFNHSKEMLTKCLEAVEMNTQKTIREILNQTQRKTIENVMILYHKSPLYVMEVLKQFLSEGSEELEPEEVADFISRRFLPIVKHFEEHLNTADCEKTIKKNILLSIGEIIRLLQSHRVSNFAYKIITLLKAAAGMTEFDEECLAVWKILICNVDISKLGSMLSNICVSLEPYIKRYPDKVNEIYYHLIVENTNLLSRNLADLFFFEKTGANNEIKAHVANQLQSQHMRDFKENFKTMLRHISEEHSDATVKSYALQYLTEIIRNHRKEFNEMIINIRGMDPTIELMLHNLVLSCKNATNENLQQFIAECLGELGAIEPSLQAPNYAVRTEVARSIHTDEFAMMALQQLCKSHHYESESKYADSQSLAIQELLKSRHVSLEMEQNIHIWEAIPEQWRPSFEHLLTSSYSPKCIDIFNIKFPIFWNPAQTAQEWSSLLTVFLIGNISSEETKFLFECLRPSMRHNWHITSCFLPYIVLHNIELASNQSAILNEFQYVFSIVMGASVAEQDRSCKPIYLPGTSFIPTKSHPKKKSNDIQTVAIKIAKLIFEIFDFLEQWCRASKSTNQALVQKIGDFMDNFNLKRLAEVNFKCGEYARALIFLESYIKVARNIRMQQELPFLAKIYAELDNSDGVEGVKSLKVTEWSLEDKVLISNVTGQVQESAPCFERMMQVNEISKENVATLIKYYIGLDQQETALLISDSIMRKLHDENLKVLKAEPLWRLSKFEELEELMSDPIIHQSSDWGVRCGQLLLKLRNEDNEGFFGELKAARMAVLKALKISGTEETAYKKNYQGIVKLHLISEIEKTEKAIAQTKLATTEAMKITQVLMEEWKRRLDFVQPNAALVEPIYCMRRILLNEMKNRFEHMLSHNDNFKQLNQLIDCEIGNLWILSTKSAYKRKMFQQAQLYILNAEIYKPKDLFIVKAKYHWHKGDINNALKILEAGTSDLLKSEQNNPMSTDEKATYAKGKLLIARYNADATNVDIKTNSQYFYDAFSAEKNEKSCLLMAEYLDQHYAPDNITGEKLDDSMIKKSMLMYGKSMSYGCKYLFQSMPRFLSIWFDATCLYEQKREKQSIIELNNFVETVNEKLPASFLYTAFSQLTSRISHPSHEVYQTLKGILRKLVQQYPHQSIWFLLPSLKSAHNIRVKRCNDILNDRILKKEEIQQCIKDINSIAETFVLLAQYDGRTRSFPVSKVSTNLERRVKQAKMLVPIRRNLKLMRDINTNSLSFPDELVWVHHMESQVSVMTSLQSPKKITLVGEDGKHYLLLCKIDKDVRRDYRVMDFMAVVNEYLHKDPEARQRRMGARLYSVVPLTTEASLIEWVPNLRTYKDVVYSQYKKLNRYLITGSELTAKYAQRPKGNERFKLFRSLRDQHFPVFGEWFRDQFPNPHNYYQARSTFINSTATMSIMCYILGIGDRHCENILLDTISGQLVHVDFNIIFNSGENLGVPETVPFRLTHNMIDAMGVLGVEGPFRRCCEIILCIMQREKTALLSYLRPFVFDQLLGSDTERVDINALKQITEIKSRLMGFVRKYQASTEIALSTEGQVAYLINEATSEWNQAMMFEHWGAFL